MKATSPRKHQEGEAQKARAHEQGRPEEGPPRIDEAVVGPNRGDPEDERSLERQVMDDGDPAGKPGRWGGKGLWAALVVVALLIAVLIGTYGA